MDAVEPLPDTERLTEDAPKEVNAKAANVLYAARASKRACKEFALSMTAGGESRPGGKPVSVDVGKDPIFPPEITVRPEFVIPEYAFSA